MADEPLIRARPGPGDWERLERLRKFHGLEDTSKAVRAAIHIADAQREREEEARRQVPRLIGQLRSVGIELGGTVQTERQTLDWITLTPEGSEWTYWREPDGELVGLRQLEDGRTEFRSFGMPKPTRYELAERADKATEG
jgi:hypothetical protein